MPRFSTERRVRYSPEQMFALVADIEKYPEFLPLCESLHVRSRRERDGRTIVTASMTVGYKAIRESFTTQVYLQPDQRVIDVSYVDGPFRYLTLRWGFEPAGEGDCTIKLFLDYEFKSRMLGALMGAMFDRAFRRMVEAFEARAAVVYGARVVA